MKTKMWQCALATVLAGLWCAPALAILDANSIDGGAWDAAIELNVLPNVAGTVDGDGTILNAANYFGNDWNLGNPADRWDLGVPGAGQMSSNQAVNGFRAFTQHASPAPGTVANPVAGAPAAANWPTIADGFTLEFALRVKHPSNNAGGGHIGVAFTTKNAGLHPGDDPWGVWIDFRDGNPESATPLDQVVDNRGNPRQAASTPTRDAIHVYRVVVDPTVYDSPATDPRNIGNGRILGRLYKDNVLLPIPASVQGVAGDGGMRWDAIYAYASSGWTAGIGVEWEYSRWRKGAHDAIPEPASMTLLGLGVVALVSRRR